MSEQVLQFLIHFGYLGVLLALYVEHVFPPIPAQVVLPVAGLLIGRGDLSFSGVLLAACLGAVLGSSTLYLLGYWMHEPIINRYSRLLKLSPEKQAKHLAFIQRYGNSMVFISHTIPLSPVRVLVSLMAGANRMALGRFLLFCTLGSLVWIGGQLYVAVFIGENWGILFEIIRQQPGYFIAVSLLAVGIVLGWYRWRRSRIAAMPTP
jgi:membrane protein DedA with SNARE-associated domain